MIVNRPARFSAVFLCVTCAAAWAQTTQPAKRELTFTTGAAWILRADSAVKGDTMLTGAPWNIAWPHPAIPNTVTFTSSFVAAGETCVVDPLSQRDDVAFSPDQWFQPQALNSEIQKRADQCHLSPAQRELLAGPTGVIIYQADRRGFSCLAVSEEDARSMADALLDCIDSQRRRMYDRGRGDLEATEKLIAEGPGQIAGKEKEKEELEKSIEALSKVVVVAQWSDRGVGDYKIELQKLVRSINVEIAGIQAKLDAIKKLRSTAKEALALHLDQMQATQDVELAGAMVRKNMVEIDLKNTTDYSDAMIKLPKLKESIASLEGGLKNARMWLPGLQETLERNKHLLEPVSVIGPITISPLVRPTPHTQPDLPPSTDEPSISPVSPTPRAR